MSLTQNDSEKINKYLIRLGKYHRLLLKSEIDCSEPLRLYIRKMLKSINLYVIYFPEFENYRLFKGDFSNTNKDKEKENYNDNNNINNLEEPMMSKIWEGTKSILLM
jgi:hypothetical protein